MKICFAQSPDIIPINTGIGRVVHAQWKYLPLFDCEPTTDPTNADIFAAHANAENLKQLDVLHIHGFYWVGEAESGKYNRYHDAINRKIAIDARRSRAITVPSDWVAEPFRRDMRIRPSVIGHGIDIDEWKPGDDIRAYCLWNKNRNQDVCDPTPVHELSDRGIPVISTFGHNERARAESLRVIGAQDPQSMKKLIQNSGIYLATTKETFGIGTLEALASGVPVLGFNHGGTATIIEHKVTGYLVEPGDYDGLAEGYHWLMQNRARLSINARYRAQDFEWKNVIGRYAQLYRDVEHDRVHEERGVSVVITNYNYAQYVGSAVQSCLNQTRPPEEIIIVDDGSTDESQAVYDTLANIPSITVIHQKNAGVAAARNAGINYASQAHIICLDADDMLDPRMIASLWPFMLANRGVGIAYTGLSIIGADENMRYVNNWPPEFDWKIQATPGIPPNNCIPSGCMFRKDMWTRAGGYQQVWAPGEDAEFWTRGLSVGFDAVRVTQEPLFWYRVHENSASKTKTYKRIDTWLPWMRDKIFPLAAPAIEPIPVRSYSNPIVTVIISPYDADSAVTIDSILGQTLREWEIIANDVPFDVFSYPFVKYSDHKPRGIFNLIVQCGEYLDPTALERMIRAYADTEVLTEGLTMGCNCGGKQAANKARQLINGMNNITVEEQQTMGIESPKTVRMEFIGIQAGARTFYGAVKSRTYRGGRNPSCRYADVVPEDVEALESTEQWKRVQYVAYKPINPPEEIIPTRISRPYAQPDAENAQTPDILDGIAKISDDTSEIARSVDESLGLVEDDQDEQDEPDTAIKRGRGRPRKAVSESV